MNHRGCALDAQESRSSHECARSDAGDVATASPPSGTPWSLGWEEVAGSFGVCLDRGLDEEEVSARRTRCGENRLRAARPERAWRIFVRQLESLIVLLLLAAGGVALAFGEAREAVAIAAVVVINTAIGFITELKAVRSMEALRGLGKVHARTRRAGAVVQRAAWELVPGDVVILEAGDLVPADVRLAMVSKLQADESTLTGESAPVSKALEALEPTTPLAERRNMLYRGTALTRGSAEGIVVATGMRAEIGRIAALVEEAGTERTPLERRLDHLGGRLVWVTLAVTVAVTVSGVLAGKDLLLMIETGIALAVATVPEGLPIVATLALARGMWRMARRNALVNRLSAVEALGSTTVICTDKTGTLTENRMTVTRVIVDEHQIDVRNDTAAGEARFESDGAALDAAMSELLRRTLEIAVLCNNAEVPDDAVDDTADSGGTGDPLEVALLVAGLRGGVRRPALLARHPEVREEAFLPESRRMATVHATDGGFLVAVKGAPEAVLASSSHVLTRGGERPLDERTRGQWLERNARMADDGLRVLALATKTATSSDGAPYEDLVFVGLVGLLDPPRRDVRGAIDACHAAGIRVVMVTGDQEGTARAIGRALGLVVEDSAPVVHGAELETLSQHSAEGVTRILATPIFARVSPEQKLNLIATHQEHGAIVAMTGDGVNDAPALKKADVGVAMGKRGTQVAAEAADVVLRDDAFSTIVMAIEQGRVIFDNIRKFVIYLLSCNVSEVMVIAVASVAQMPLPITPLQILFLNLVTDVFPALALGAGEGDPTIARRPPRDPNESILARRHWLAIASYALVLTLCTLAAMLIALWVLDRDAKAAVTVSFLTLAFAQLWHVFNMGGRRSGVLRSDVARNPYVWGALALCTALLMAAVYLPPLAVVLDIEPPDAVGWAVIAGLSWTPVVIGHVLRAMPRPARRAV